MMDVNMNTVIPIEFGIWIECCNPKCKKWRYVTDIDDPQTVPKKWYCFMNSNKSINSCSAPENLELEDDEVFVESRFKAGSVVWAKVVGFPWSPAMVDLCPDFECYYWFDNVNSNIPTQYHVTFFNTKMHTTRAWVKNPAIKSFIGNEDASKILKLRVKGKKLSSVQKARIIENCQMAQEALRLPISQRLKKYNFESWKLTRCPKTQSANTKSENIGVTSDKGAGPSNIQKCELIKNDKARKSANLYRQQSTNLLPKNTKVDFTNSKDKTPKTTEKQMPELNPPAAKEMLKSRKTVSLTKNCTDSEISTTDSNMSASVTENTVDTPDFNDTFSITSSNLLDDANSFTEGSVRTSNVQKQTLEVRLHNGHHQAINVVMNKGILNKELTNVPCKTNKETMQLSARFGSDALLLNSKKESNESNDVDADAFEAILSSPKKRSRSNLSLKINALNIERKRNRCTIVRKSLSETMNQTKNKENVVHEPRYVRALSAFMTREEVAPCNGLQRQSISVDSTKLAYNFTKPIAMCNKLPSRFSDKTKRQEYSAQMYDKLLAKLTTDEDDRINRENRENFLSQSLQPVAGTSLSTQRNKPILSSDYYFEEIKQELMTSDESF